MQTKLLKGRTPLYLVLLLLVVAVMLYLRTHSGARSHRPLPQGGTTPRYGARGHSAY